MAGKQLATALMYGVSAMLMMLTTVSQIIMHSMEYSHGIVAIPSL